MKLRILAFVTLFVFMAGGAFAHGNKKHVIGTLTQVSPNAVTVKSADGKSVQVILAPATAYVLKKGTEEKPAKFADLAVGDRVVIHATPSGPEGEILTADEVKFSLPGAPSSGVHPEQRQIHSSFGLGNMRLRRIDLTIRHCGWSWKAD